MCRQIIETSELLWMYLEELKITCIASVVHKVEVIFHIRKLRTRIPVNYKPK
jgi:hypothetical protein